MRNLVSVFALVFVIRGAQAASTNLPPASTRALMLNSNGVIVAPISAAQFRSSNDIASAGALLSVSNRAALSLTNGQTGVYLQGTFAGDGSAITGLTYSATGAVASVTAGWGLTNAGTASEPMLQIDKPTSNRLASVESAVTNTPSLAQVLTKSDSAQGLAITGVGRIAMDTCQANEHHGIALGTNAEAGHPRAFVWNGRSNGYSYSSSGHGDGSFNIWPEGGINGVYIGNDTLPEKIRSDFVGSVFGRTGSVVATAGDYTAAQVGALAYPTNGASGGPALGWNQATSNTYTYTPAAGGGGGGDVYSTSNNTFASSTPITLTNANAAVRWIGAGYTNTFYCSSTQAVYTLGGVTYAFP
jgi:hypothetical protein